MAALVFGLAVPLAISGAPAQALVKPDTALKAGKGFVVKGGQGVVKFGKVPGPVGAIITAGQLAWWAYSAADGDVHAPQPGGSAEDWLGAPAPAYPTAMNDGVMSATVAGVSGSTITLTIQCNSWSYFSGPQNPPQAWTLYKCDGANVPNPGSYGVGSGSTNGGQVECRNISSGAAVVRTLSASWTSGAYAVGGGGGPVTVPYQNACNSGEEVIGFRVPAWTGTNPTSATWYQTAPIGWGTLGGSTTTYPPGDLTFETAVVDVTCKNAATGAVEHIIVTSDWGASDSLVLPSCKQRLGDEWYGVGVKVIPMDPEIEGVPLDPEVWPDWDVPDFIPEEWQPEELTPEEEADPCHGTKTGCGLSIAIDGEPVFPGTTTRTKIDTLIGSQPDRVTCKWGTKQVDWKWCIPLLPTFEPGSSGQTTTDPTKPDTGTGTPTTGTGTQPVPTEGQNCIKAAFSWNPVDWVFVPVKCALKWAFVPDPASWGWPAFVDQVMARPPTSIAVALVAQMQAVADGFGSGSCGVLADFGDGMAITCPAIQAIPGYGALYALVQVGLVGLTGFTVFHMFRSVLGSEGNG